jgi:hypothetical protein
MSKNEAKRLEKQKRLDIQKAEKAKKKIELKDK